MMEGYDVTNFSSRSGHLRLISLLCYTKAKCRDSVVDARFVRGAKNCVGLKGRVNVTVAHFMVSPFLCVIYDFQCLSLSLGLLHPLKIENRGLDDVNVLRYVYSCFRT